MIPQWFIAKSIKSQLIVLLFSLTAISVVAVGYLGVASVVDSGRKAQVITSDAMQKRVEQFLVQTATATAEKNSLVFGSVQLESSNLAAYATNILENPAQYARSGWRFDEHVSRQGNGAYANPPTEPGSVFIPSKNVITPLVKQQFELAQYFDHLFPSVLANDSNAVAAYFTTAKGETKYYPNIDLANVAPQDYTPLGDVFYTPATPENNPEKTVKWSVVYDDPAGNGLMITAVKPVYTKQAGFTGLTAIDVTLGKIASNIESYTPIESSYAFLVDKSGRAVALPNQAYRDILNRSAKKDEFGPDLSNAAGEFGAVLKKMRGGTTGFSKISANQRDLYVAYAPVQGTPFSLGIAAQQAALLKVVGDLQKEVDNSTAQMVYGRVLPVGLGLLVVVWLYGFFYIKRFTDPIKKLTAKTTQLSGGNFDVEPEIISSDNEIGQLAGSFNTMVADLKTSHMKIKDQNKELMRERSRLEASINSLPFGFAIINLKHEIVFHNALLAALFEKSIPDDPKASRAVFEEIGRNLRGSIDLMDYITKAQTSRRPMERNVEVGPHFFRFFFMPIVDEAGSGQQVIGTVMTMENTSEARASERSRDEFFSIASHELRTPLTAIRGNSNMMMEYYKEQLKDPSLRDMVSDIHSSSLRLITIVNDFLDISRLEQGKIAFKISSFDLLELVNAVLNDLNVVDANPNLKIEVEQPATPLPLASADPDRARQILLNLVGNAIKYTEKGLIKIRLESTVKGKSIKVVVSDTGSGIPLESQHLLFHKFQQASNNILTRDNTQSTGLGLYISKLLAEGMKGKLYLEHTEVGKGSVFAFELPVAKPAKPRKKTK